MFKFFSKKQPTTLRLDSPCQERWENMQTAGLNKFCASCSKQVIDFTAMSDERLLEYLENSKGSACGRFRNDQLNRALLETKKNYFSGFKTGLATLLLFFNFLAGKIQSQTRILSTFAIDYNGDTLKNFYQTNPEFDKVVTADSSLSKTDIKIKGHVYYSGTKVPIENITVLLQDSSRNCVTDWEGYFEFNLTDSMVQDTLVLLFTENGEVLHQESLAHASLASALEIYLSPFMTEIRVSANADYRETQTSTGLYIREHTKLKLTRKNPFSSLFDFRANLNAGSSIHPNLKGEADIPRLID